MICELTGMDIANASMYDGSTGAAEAVMMAVRVTGRDNVLVVRTVHPEYREVMHTYAQHRGTTQARLRTGRTAVSIWPHWSRRSPKRRLAFSCSRRIFSASSKTFPPSQRSPTRRARCRIVSIAEAVSLGIVRPPVEADIVSMEAQSFGVALSYGGPYCGVLAAKEKYLRQMPGRLVGETKDTEGRRGFVLTLSTREQHIRREKATSNICTNQALVALMTTIFLSVYGKQGMRELALQNLAKATDAADTLGVQGKLLFDQAPRFHEFVLQTDEDPEQLNARLLEKKIIGGLDLRKWYPELGNATLWCATELTTKDRLTRRRMCSPNLQLPPKRDKSD